MKELAVEIQVVRKGTTRNKLTIAKDRIELKVIDAASAESEQWLLGFAQKVADEVAKAPSEFTLRGRIEWHQNSQRMTLGLGYGDHGQKEIRWFYSDQMGLPSPPEDIR